LRIDGLAPGDEDRLESVLRALPGVFGVVVSAAEGCAEVDFADDEVDLDRILGRLRDSGYDATLSG
ncbi:MAG: heavy-metal-associated domain-containing protein, partial [Gemmatimonadota bacterium]